MEQPVSKDIAAILEGLSLALDQLIAIHTELKGLRKELGERETPTRKEGTW